jgi:hypothetical protein
MNAAVRLSRSPWNHPKGSTCLPVSDQSNGRRKSKTTYDLFSPLYSLRELGEKVELDLQELLLLQRLPETRVDSFYQLQLGQLYPSFATAATASNSLC